MKFLNKCFNGVLSVLLFVFINLPAIVWYTISGAINFYGGWVFCESLGVLGQIGGGAMLLVVQLSLPYYEYQSKKQNKPYVIGKTLSWLVTLICLVYVISNFISTKVGEEMKTGFNIKANTVLIENSELQLEHIDVSNTPVVSNDQIESLFSKIKAIESTPAKNFAGDQVYVNGKAATVMSVTNSCTLTGDSMDVYMTNDKLYKSHCEQLNNLNEQIRSLTILAGGESKAKKLDTANNVSKDLSDAYKQTGEMVGEQYNRDSLLIYLLDGIDTNNTDPNYLLQTKEVIDDRSTRVAVIVGSIGMTIEYMLMQAFVGQFFPNNNPSFWKSTWLLLMALWNVVMTIFVSLFNFIFRNKNSDNPKEQPDTFDANEWVSGLTLSSIQSIQDMGKLNSVRGSVVLDDILSLQLAVTQLYSAGEALPLKSTITTLKDKVLTNEHYSKRLSPNGKVLTEEQVDDIFKVNRLKKFYWEVFKDSLLDDINGKYHWKSEKDIELFYHRSKNH